jgi:hypothetical protein
MNALHPCATFAARALLLGWSALSMAEDPASLVLSAKDFGYPVIDTTITFTRVAEHTFRVQYSSAPPSSDHLMLYTGFYFCAARKLALDAGFDRTALTSDPDPQPRSGGIAIFLKPGEEASRVLEPRFAGATFSSIELFAPNCPTQTSPAK